MSKIKETFVCVFIAFLLIALVSIPKKKEDKNKTISLTLPKNTLQHCYVDPFPIFINCIFDELFIIQDAQVIKDAKNLINNLNQTKNITDLGVDFGSPLELIEMNFDQNSIVLLRAKIVNSKKFKENFRKQVVKCFFIDQQAYFTLNDKINVKKLINKIEKTSISINIRNPGGDVILSQFKNNKVIQRHRLHMSSEEISLKINGLVKNKKSHVRLNPAGMHSTFLLQKLVSRLPNNYLKEISFLKIIQNVSINYYGFELEDEGEVIGVPKFDLLLTFQSNQNCNVFLDALQKTYNIPIVKTDSSYKIGSQNLFLKQVNKKIIYFSTKIKNEELNKSSELFQFEGDLKMLTKIENSGWKGLVLDFIPGYQASKDLLETTDILSMKRINKNTSVIKVSFKKDENTYHSFLKLLLLLSAE